MRARDAGVLGAAAVATLLLWLATGTEATLPELQGRARGWSGDFMNYYLPNAEYAGARLAEGELPLWNPRQAAGIPFLATLQVGALYPPNLLHALLPAQTAFLVLAGLHLLLSFVLAGALASALGAGALGSAVAGLAYASSLQLVGAIWSPPTYYAAAWAPGVLLAVDRVIARASPRRAVALALAVAMPLLSGWPYTLALAALGAALYGGVCLMAGWLRTRRFPSRPVVALTLGALAGLMLAAPQTLPTGELVARSCRALGTLVEAQAVFVDSPHDPSVFLSRLVRRGRNDGVPGAASLILAALALALPGPGRARVGVLLGVGALALMASFPRHTPVYGWLRELPLLGDFRFPYRYRLLLTLAIAIAAGVGTTHLQRALARWPRAALAAGAAALAICAVTATLPVFRGVLPFARAVPEARPLARELEEAGVAVPAGGLDRVYWAGRADKLRLPGDAYAVHDLEPLTLARTAQLLTFLEVGRPRTVLTLERELAATRPRGDAVAAPFYGLVSLPRKGERAAILDLFSARTIVSEKSPGWLGRRYRRASPPDSALAVFENPNALPRAYRVARALPEPRDLSLALQRVASPAFDLRRLVLLDKPPRELLARPGSRRPAPSGEVRVAIYQPERVVLHTRGDQPAAVVLTDAYFPGWEATLDGDAVALLRANLNFRAVAVPPGEHEIEMRYRPASLRWGAGLALVAAAACAVAALLRRPRD
jgi:hypothetical protein